MNSPSPPTDQRGITRPNGTAPDAGAYEATCHLDQWAVSTYVGLSDAIGCYNAKTDPTPNYQITIAADVVANPAMDQPPPAITNAVAPLTIAGNGHTIDAAGLGTAVTVSGTTLNINDLAITGANTTNGEGGGIDNTGGIITITNSVIHANTTNGDGGAIRNQAGTITFTNSTLSGNMAAVGGAIANMGGTVNVWFSTVTNNTAAGGAGIHSTTSPASVTVGASIIADNNGPDLDGTTFTSDGYNIVGTGNAVTAFTGAGDQTGIVEPLLGPLANNNSPLLNHLPALRSPAVDAVTAAIAADQTHDQRGEPTHPLAQRRRKHRRNHRPNGIPRPRRGQPDRRCRLVRGPDRRWCVHDCVDWRCHVYGFACRDHEHDAWRVFGYRGLRSHPRR